MSEQVVVFALLALGGYIAWCWAYPYRSCPRCGGKKTAGDGRGNYRDRWRCWVCGGRPYRRVGARLIGRGR